MLRSGSGPAPKADTRPAELAGWLLILADLRAAPQVALPPGTPDRVYRVALTGDMTAYRCGITAPRESSATLAVRRGQRIRLVLENRTMM